MWKTDQGSTDLVAQTESDAELAAVLPLGYRKHRAEVDFNCPEHLVHEDHGP